MGSFTGDACELDLESLLHGFIYTEPLTTDEYCLTDADSQHCMTAESTSSASGNISPSSSNFLTPWMTANSDATELYHPNDQFENLCSTFRVESAAASVCCPRDRKSSLARSKARAEAALGNAQQQQLKDESYRATPQSFNSFRIATGLDATSELRREKNRVCQRNFRARKSAQMAAATEYIGKLEQYITLLERQISELRQDPSSKTSRRTDEVKG